MNIIKALQKEYNGFPKNGKLYRISDGVDITPSTEAHVQYLTTLDESEVEVIVPPQDPITILITVVVTVAVTVAVVSLLPDIPEASTRDIPEASPNNGLGSRSNQVRVGARRPDIYGKVNSTPDLLTQAYRIYTDNVEKEFNYMFVSEGTVTCDTFRDGSSQVKNLIGSSAELYLPSSYPIASAPYIRHGVAIIEPLLDARKIAGVTGQTLNPPGESGRITDNIRPLGTNEIQFETATDVDTVFEVGDTASFANQTNDSTYATPAEFEFTPANGFNYFGIAGDAGGEAGVTGSFDLYNTTLANLHADIAVGNLLSSGLLGVNTRLTITGIEATNMYADASLTNPIPTVRVHVLDLTVATGLQNTSGDVGVHELVYGGEYLVESVTATSLFLVGADFTGRIPTPNSYVRKHVLKRTAKWTSDYIIEDDNATEAILNFTAPNGIYKDDGENQYSTFVRFTIRTQQLDANDTPLGASVDKNFAMRGSGEDRDAVNATIRLPIAGRTAIQVHRDSPAKNDTLLPSVNSNFEITSLTDGAGAFTGQFQNDVKWEALYSTKPMPSHSLTGTRVRTQTVANEGALALSQRKLTLEGAIRHIPMLQADGTMTLGNFPTQRMQDVLVAVTRNDYIGRRSVSSLNLENIRDVAASMSAYYNSGDAATEFNYTFDSHALTYEDTVALICAPSMVRAYRRGGKLNLDFERENTVSTLLFNNRNKAPGSEKRTIKFGGRTQFDSVVTSYQDNDAILRTVTVPSSSPAQAPMELDVLGLNENQAKRLANREWNKLRYQHTFVEFTATEEAALLVLGQRILVTDNTLSQVTEGEVVEQVGNILALSEAPTADGWIHLQVDDASVQVRSFTLAGGNMIILGSGVSGLSTDLENFARATYAITAASSDAQAFILLDKDDNGDGTFLLSAGNYDDRFYDND